MPLQRAGEGGERGLGEGQRSQTCRLLGQEVGGRGQQRDTQVPILGTGLACSVGHRGGAGLMGK